MADRRDWSKINVPQELGDLVRMIGKKYGYGREDIHLLVFDLLKHKYPEDVERLQEFIGADWMEDPPPPES